jgi:C_GCAxxG_C_C family probable redox protein
MAFTLGRAFGAGMGLGSICGAVTGSFMILGFKNQGHEDERQARYKTYDLVREFVRLFQAQNGTILCKELLRGVDLSTDSGRQQASERKLFTTLCPAIVRNAAEILEDLL